MNKTNYRIEFARNNVENITIGGSKIVSNDTIAGDGSVLKVYMLIMCFA